jgi:hypothetical protein
LLGRVKIRSNDVMQAHHKIASSDDQPLFDASSLLAIPDIAPGLSQTKHIGRQLFDQFAVSGQEVQLWKDFRLAPRDLLKHEVFRLGRVDAGEEENQLDGFVHFGAPMACAVDFGANPRFHAQLFAQLALKGSLECFTMPSLSAGEFPHELERVSAPPLAHKQFSLMLNQRCNDSQHRFSSRSICWMLALLRVGGRSGPTVRGRVRSDSLSCSRIARAVRRPHDGFCHTQ